MLLWRNAESSEMRARSTPPFKRAFWEILAMSQLYEYYEDSGHGKLWSYSRVVL